MPLRKIKRYVPCRFRKEFDPQYHCHVVEVVDLAMGVPLPNGDYPGTAFRFRCKICGRVIDDITAYGIEQLQAGHKPEDVFRWMEEGRHDTSD